MCAKARAAEIRAQVLALVLAAPDGISREAIRQALGLPMNAVHVATRELLAEGLIAQAGGGASVVWSTPERCAAIRAARVAEQQSRERVRRQRKNAQLRAKRAAERVGRVRRPPGPAPKPGPAVRIKSPPPAPMFVFNLARLSQHESTECTPC